MKKLVFAVIAALLAMNASTSEAASRSYTIFAQGATYGAGHIEFQYVSGDNLNGNAPVADTEIENTPNVDYDTEIKFGSNSQKVTTNGTRYIAFRVSIDTTLNVNDWSITHFYASMNASTVGTGVVTLTVTPYLTYSGVPAQGVAAFTDPINFQIVGTDSYFNDAQSAFYLVASWSSSGTNVLNDFTIGLGTMFTGNTAVPEPSTMAVFGGIAMLGLVAIRRNRKA